MAFVKFTRGILFLKAQRITLYSDVKTYNKEYGIQCKDGLKVQKLTNMMKLYILIVLVYFFLILNSQFHNQHGMHYKGNMRGLQYVVKIIIFLSSGLFTNTIYVLSLSKF